MKKEQKIIFFSILALVIFFVVGANLYKPAQSNTVAKDLLYTDYSYQKGEKNAKVKLVEFFDPACGTCAQFHFFIKDILTKYDGKIELTLRYAPFHPNVSEVVKILEASREQNLYEETLELVFKTQDKWVINHTANLDELWKILQASWIDIERLKKAMRDKKIEEHIDTDIKAVEALNIKQTPTFYVNGKELLDFGSKQLLELIESAL
ncbi:MAG: thioredoxin domain-containing protein [Sulfurospirillum sp.]|nr:thioredoxin domain-containing protein [Sulfurospirillum sp.]